MKNKKWLTYTLAILFTLIALTVVAGAGFRAGMMQNTSFLRPPFAHNFNGGTQVMQRNPHDDRNAQPMQGDSHNNGFNNNNRGGDRRGGGMPFFSPIFGLIHLAVLGVLLWIGYKLVKKSGWRLARVEASASPTVSETPSVEVEEKKKSE